MKTISKKPDTFLEQNPSIAGLYDLSASSPAQPSQSPALPFQPADLSPADRLRLNAAAIALVEYILSVSDEASGSGKKR